MIDLDNQVNIQTLKADPIGEDPLFYYHDGQKFYSARNLKDLLIQPDIDVQINEGWVIDYVTKSVIENAPYSDETYYKHVYQVEPGFEVTFKDGKLHKKRYWDLNDFRTDEVKSDQYYIDGLRDRLIEAVKSRVRGVECVASELSGGIDSSTVAALAAGVRSDLIVLHNKAPKDSSELNETPYARAVCEFANIQSVYEFENPRFDLLDSIKYAALRAATPLPNIYAALVNAQQEQAKSSGVRVILSGFGGDECVSQQGARYLTRVAKQWKLKKLFYELNARSKLRGGKPYKRFLGYLIRNIYPSFRQQKKQFWSLSKFHLDDDFIERHKDSFQEQYELFRDFSANTLTHDCYVGFLQGRSSAHVRNRLTYTALSSLEGLEYRYPLLDREVLEFMMSVPERMHFRHGYGRYLLREAMKGILPESVRLRDNKAGAPVPGSYHLMCQQLKHLGVDSSPSNFHGRHYYFRHMLDVLSCV